MSEASATSRDLSRPNRTKIAGGLHTRFESATKIAQKIASVKGPKGYFRKFESKRDGVRSGDVSDVRYFLYCLISLKYSYLCSHVVPLVCLLILFSKTSGAFYVPLIEFFLHSFLMCHDIKIL